VKRALAALLVLSAVLASAASGARVKAFDVKAPLTIELPAGWKTVRADPGWRFKAVAPDHSAWTFLSARPDTVDFKSYAASFVAFEKQSTSTLGRRVTFRTHAATVGGERAVQVYAAAHGAPIEYFYGFVHNGVDYVLAFAATAEHAKASTRIFAAAVRSVRFKNP
jgi:hypothetical protein